MKYSIRNNIAVLASLATFLPSLEASKVSSSVKVHVSALFCLFVERKEEAAMRTMEKKGHFFAMHQLSLEKDLSFCSLSF